MTTIYRDNVLNIKPMGKVRGKVTYNVRFFDEEANTYRLVLITGGDKLLLERTGEVKIDASE